MQDIEAQERLVAAMERQGKPAAKKRKILSNKTPHKSREAICEELVKERKKFMQAELRLREEECKVKTEAMKAKAEAMAAKRDYYKLKAMNLCKWKVLKWCRIFYNSPIHVNEFSVNACYTNCDVHLIFFGS